MQNTYNIDFEPQISRQIKISQQILEGVFCSVWLLFTCHKTVLIPSTTDVLDGRIIGFSPSSNTPDFKESP